MQHLGQTLSDVDTRVHEAVHPLHRGPVDINRGVVPSLLLPRIQYQLLSLGDIQEQVVVLTPGQWW